MSLPIHIILSLYDEYRHLYQHLYQYRYNPELQLFIKGDGQMSKLMMDTVSLPDSGPNYCVPGYTASVDIKVASVFMEYVVFGYQASDPSYSGVLVNYFCLSCHTLVASCIESKGV